jgi:unsaturated rhamnogalacturonyl hydrolase
MNKFCARIFILLFITALLVAPACRAAAQTDFAGATPLLWSVRMADSEMARLGDKFVWKEGSSVHLDYTAGLFTLALLKLNEKIPDARYVEFTKSSIGSLITDDGGIRTYKADEFQLDSINPGKTVLALWQLTHEERYHQAAALLRKQFDIQPRTSDGGFWHKQRYTNQMWLDGLYMGAPFYAEYAKLFAGSNADFDDVGKQFALVKKHLLDAKTGLYYHGWDEKKTQSWANPKTGASSNFWGRALGWYAMALVDTLDYLPGNHPARKDLTGQIKNLFPALVKYQDADSGLWWQVTDQGRREGNYLEATASAMFVYALAKAVNDGELSRDYIPAIVKGYHGIVTRLIKPDGDKISLTQCCSVAGLGFTTGGGRPRDGSFAYYISEPVVENDLKGVGPFILAGIQMQKLLGLPMTASATAMPADDNAAIAKAWAQVPEILARIKAPVFPAREFSILKYGAVAGGTTDSSAAIARAIDACHESGGGRVLVPAGEFLTGPIHLKSNVELHLATNAMLKFTTNFAAYLPLVFTRYEGTECYNYSPLIYAFGQQNVAVTGAGTLDGQADDSSWLAWKNISERKKLAQMAQDGVPVAQRQFGEGGFLRPNFIQFYRCANILIEGVRIRRSPMWELNPVLCTNVTVRGVDIVSHGANNDGCDPESCRDVLIENCLFDTGDDCIAIKSGRNNDGRRVGVPAENLIIRNCTMRDGHGGVTIGSEISGSCSNVFVENCEMSSPDLTCALRLKSNAVRGGVIQNIFMRNVNVGLVKDSVLQIDFLYEEGAKGDFNPVARNVVMQNIAVAETPRVLNVRGFPAASITGVRIYDSTFKQVKKPDVLLEADVMLVNCVLETAPK